MVKLLEGLDRSFMLFEISGQSLFYVLQVYVVVLIIYILATYFMKGFEYVELALNETVVMFDTLWNTLDCIFYTLEEIIFDYILDPIYAIAEMYFQFWELMSIDIWVETGVASLETLYTVLNMFVCLFSGNATI